eukprot:377427_1
MSFILWYFSLLLSILIITTIAKHPPSESTFSFEGTYNLRIGAEDRSLSVCEEPDSGVIFWGLSKIRSGKPGANTIDYVYAVGRDQSGMEKILYKKNKYMYEAECDSFWFKEEDDGARLIQYYLRYNPGEKYSQRYSLSTAKVTDDPTSIDSIYYLDKISDQVLGECFIYGDLTFDDIQIQYPTTYQSNDLTELGLCREKKTCYLIRIQKDSQNICSGIYEPETNEFYGVTAIDPMVPINYQWGKKLQIYVVKTTNPNCVRLSVLNVAEFYGDGENTHLVSSKCIASNLGFMLRLNQIDNIYGIDCPQTGPAPTTPPPTDICMEPKDEGTCNHFIKRYYYDQNRHKCKSFQYSGCGGNKNNFQSKTDCNKACKWI